jgi:hypothetical protein
MHEDRSGSETADDAHTCAPPLRPPGTSYPAHRIDGRPGDVWRCGCGRVWEVRLVPHRVGTVDALAWSPAGAWSRVRLRLGFAASTGPRARR